jgi:hypothetical protein
MSEELPRIKGYCKDCYYGNYWRKNVCELWYGCDVEPNDYCSRWEPIDEAKK